MGDPVGAYTTPQPPSWLWSGKKADAHTSGTDASSVLPQQPASTHPTTGRLAGADRSHLGGRPVAADMLVGLAQPPRAPETASASPAERAILHGVLTENRASLSNGDPTNVLSLSAGLASHPDLTMGALLAFAADPTSTLRAIGLDDQSGRATAEALRNAPAIRVALTVHRDALETIDAARTEIQTLQNDAPALAVHLGHIAASSRSAQQLSTALEGLGLPAHVRMDAAVTLQSLHRDPQRLALFMAGEDVGLNAMIVRIQRALPKSVDALNRMEADLVRTGFQPEELLHRREFSSARRRVVTRLAPEDQGLELAERVKTLGAKHKRGGILGGAAVEMQIQQSDGEQLKQAWGIGSILLSTREDIARVRMAAHYTNHGLAEPSLADHAAASFVVNRVQDGLGAWHPAAGFAVDALKAGATYVP